MYCYICVLATVCFIFPTLIFIIISLGRSINRVYMINLPRKIEIKMRKNHTFRPGAVKKNYILS